MINFLTSGLSQKSGFLRGSFERCPGVGARDYSIGRIQADFSSYCVTLAFRLGPGFHQECDRLSGVPDDVKTIVYLQLDVCIPDAGHGVLRGSGFPQTYIRENCSNGAVLGSTTASSISHLRRNYRAGDGGDGGRFVRTDVGLWLLDRGLRQIWWNIRRQVRREYRIRWLRNWGLGHARLLFGGATTTKWCLFQKLDPFAARRERGGEA